MKKISVILITMILMISFASCGNVGTTETSTDSNNSDAKTEFFPTTTQTNNLIDLDKNTSIDELEVLIEEQLSNSIDSLSVQWKNLSVEIDTYQKYIDNPQKVSAFYQTVITETEQMSIMLLEYSAIYARTVLDSDMSAEDKYDAIGGINDCLYDDACDEIKDEVYGGILDDMKDFFYEGIIDDAKKEVNYNTWYDVSSKEYNQWYDASSEVYSIYYDTASDIYSFYYDMSGKLYDQDFDRAEKLYNKFLEKVKEAKGIETDISTSNATFDTTLRTANNVEELEDVVDAHVSECVQALKNEWESLSNDINNFDKFTKNTDTIEDFHTHIEDSASQIFVMICNYGVLYSELILNSNSSEKDMYKDFEDFKNCIYEDACDLVKDEIYEDLLEEIKDYYYEGIIKDEKDNIEYSTWSDARGDSYNWWSDARSEVYESWSDTRSDLYDFYSDIRSKLYSEDIDKANKEFENFKNKVSKME
ncbi:MAG: hypothetical protein J6B86_02910 [Clostridia bacterium]|nr:hypothetical protein [Clostridia bacterium]